MARSRFVPNSRGYAVVLNISPEIGQICVLAGRNAAREAHQIGGIHSEYTYDTIRGMRRWKTRVSTVRTWPSYNSERKNHALRNTIPRI